MAVSHKSPNLAVAIGSAALLAVVPLLLLIDTASAVASGWRLTSAGRLDLVPVLAALLVALVLLLFCVPPLRRWMAARPRQFANFSAGCLLGWLISEQLLLPMLAPRGDFHLRAPGAVYEFDPDPFATWGVTGSATMRINSAGVRGPELPPRWEARRVLCIGGSATECLYLDDAETWPARVGEQLRDQTGQPVWVGAAGIVDFASGHHRRFVEQSRLTGQMDNLVVLLGVNDVVRLMMGSDLGTASPPHWFRGATCQLAREWWLGHKGHGIVIDPTGQDYLLGVRIGLELPPREMQPAIETGLLEFRENVRSLYRAAQRQNVDVLFVTQPVLWDAVLPSEGRKRLLLVRVEPYPKAWDFLTPEKVREAVDRFNDALLDTCTQMGADCLDAAAEMNGQWSYFYDDYHLSEQGCLKLGRLVANRLATPSAGIDNAAP